MNISKRKKEREGKKREKKLGEIHPEKIDKKLIRCKEEILPETLLFNGAPAEMVICILPPIKLVI